VVDQAALGGPERRGLVDADAGRAAAFRRELWEKDEVAVLVEDFFIEEIKN
jgi:hypothetical protein